MQLFVLKRAFGHISGPERRYSAHRELISSLFVLIVALGSVNLSKGYFSSK